MENDVNITEDVTNSVKERVVDCESKCGDYAKQIVVASESECEDSSSSCSSSEEYIIHDGFYKLGDKETKRVNETKRDKESKRDNDASSGTINFRLKYEECLSQLNEEQNRFRKEMQLRENSYHTLQESYDELKRKYDGMEASNEKAIEMRDQQIASQKKIIEDCNATYDSLQSAEEKKDEYEKLINEHSKKLLSAEQCGAPYDHLHKINDLDKIFQIKPKKKGSYKNLQATKCEQISCESINVDMIRCSICRKYACEKCHEVQVVKLKNILEKCKTIYFICKHCDDNVGTSLHDKTEILELDRQKYQNDVATKIKTSIDDSIIRLESKLEDLINSKIDDKMIEMKNFDETLKKQNETLSIISKSYSESVQGKIATRTPIDFRQVMQETKNEELIQGRQREARSKNIIIHGFPEAPGGMNESLDSDITTIKELLAVLELDVTPESTARLGNRNDGKKRPIRIKMKSLNEKEMVMGSLGKLKTAPENLRRINVTDDYTIDERQLKGKYAQVSDR